MATIVTRAGKGSPLTNNEVDANFTNLNSDKLESGDTVASLTLTTADINGGTLDGVTIGGASAGAGTFSSLVATTADINGGTIDGVTIGGASAGAATFTSATVNGNITVTGTVDGRDVATDGTKLDGIEAGADVTDATNVTAAGALMDSELTDITAVKALDQGVATTDSPAFAGLSVNSNPIATAGSLSNRNKIINGNLGINQRGVSGTVTLSAGVYGHDRWKAGASGCTYTFATSANVTTITISAGSLVQVIEGLNLQSGTHVLSWTGTVQMKIDGGSAGNSGMTGTLTGGTNATVETSGTGTLSLVQLEAGDTATPFEHRSYGQELALCQRYYERDTDNGSGTLFYASDVTSGSVYYLAVPYKVTKRAAATVTISNTSNAGAFSSTVSPSSIGVQGFRADCSAVSTASGAYFRAAWEASAEL